MKNGQKQKITWINRMDRMDRKRDGRERDAQGRKLKWAGPRRAWGKPTGMLHGARDGGCRKSKPPTWLVMLSIPTVTPRITAGNPPRITAGNRSNDRQLHCGILWSARRGLPRTLPAHGGKPPHSTQCRSILAAKVKHLENRKPHTMSDPSLARVLAPAVICRSFRVT
jgi:hypothetical protein